MDVVGVGEERLNGELKALGLCIGGEGTFAAVATDAGAAENSLNPSSPNRSAGILVAGLDCSGGGDAAFCVKEKLSEFVGAGLLAALEKKSPPLRGGGDDTGADGAALLGTADGKFSPAKAED